jgi:UDP-2-acetamido-2-deoxy-ribo-hexuluronate aminotransferase
LIADIYNDTLSDKNLVLPKIDSDCTSTWAQYVVRVENRDTLMAKLNERGITTTVHYTIPLHLQECFAYLGYERGDFSTCEKVTEEILSIPINPYMTDHGCPVNFDYSGIN